MPWYAGVALRKTAWIWSKWAGWNIAKAAEARRADRNSVSVLPSPGGSRRGGAERAVSGTCLTGDVTLPLLVFSFELPNKSDAYLCLLLIYDFISPAVPARGGARGATAAPGSGVSPVPHTHACARLCIAVTNSKCCK